MGDFLLYGANGYTGELIARASVAAGLRPILAGRSADAIRALANELGLESRIFGLEEQRSLREGLAGVRAVLHCAGPFSKTSRPMVEACLEGRTHYLDITGEIPVFEALAARDAEARRAGVMLLPGAGFDVVPSDCLAAHVAKRLPAATSLAIAFWSTGRPSRGTSVTVIENLGSGGCVRKGGQLVPVPFGWKTRSFELGGRQVKAMTIPWGDLASAYRSTRIPDIEVYMAAPTAVRLFAKMSGAIRPLLGSKVVQGLLQRRARRGSPGPSEAQRRDARSYLFAEARTGSEVASAWLEGPDGYTTTVRTSLALVSRVLAGDARPGYQTPATAYGSDFILGIEGYSRREG